MSLNWNVTKCNRKPTGRKIADCDNDSHNSPCELCPKVEESLIHGADGAPIPWAVTNGLIWASMAVQMSGIPDEKAAREFAVRLAIYQRLFGAWLNTHGKGKPTPRKITPAEVYAHIGLSTNVSTRPRGYFLKAMGEQLARGIEQDEVGPVIEHQAKLAAGKVA